MKSNPETTRQWRQRSQQTARDNPRPRAKIRPVSAKRKRQIADYAAARLQHLEASPFCARCEALGLQSAATEIHHVGGREGARLADCSLFLGLCRPCHDWVHANPLAARESGFLTTKHLGKKL